MIEQYRAWAGIGDAPLDGWELVPHYEQDELAAIAVMKGSAIHFAINPAWRRRFFQRNRARAALAPLLARFGFLATSSFDGASRSFLKRLGFVETWAEGRVQHWMLTELPFQKD